MKITKHTRTKDIIPLLNEERLKELLEQIPSFPLEKSVMAMTIREFSDILTDEQEFLKKILSCRKAFKAFGKLKSYKVQIENISKFMKMYDHHRTKEEEDAARGIVFPEFSVRMMADAVKFFNLHSFEEAEKVTISEWLTLFQIEASQTLLAYRYQKIIEAKQRKDRRK